DSIWRHIQSPELQRHYEEDNVFRLFCGQVDALALLPPDEVQEGMEYLRSTMPDEAAPLIEYFDSTYVSGTLCHRRDNRVTHPDGVIPPIRLRSSPPLFPPRKWDMHQVNLDNNRVQTMFAKTKTTSLPDYWDMAIHLCYI
ncbi:hypothetical protein LSH36_912g01005, partial [Paralvinella palmiformis]